MKETGALQITTPTEREIVITRAFDAPRRLVFEAMTKPELLKRWLYGPGDWSLEVCEIDLRVGGAYRYVWRRVSDGTEMGMGGVHREVVPPEKLVVTERFDDAWYPGEALVTTRLVEQSGRTKLTVTILYETREARDVALRSSVDGMELGYDRLEKVLASLRTAGTEKRPKPS